MRLISIEINDLPGISPGFKFEGIHSGSNLVVGPNAIGKSSLIRALRYLFGPPKATDPKLLSLSASFETRSESWSVSRLGPNIEWQRSGQVSEAPNLPSPDQFFCYWFSVEELLGSSQEDEHFLVELRKALGGGYDLEELKTHDEFGKSSRHGLNQVKVHRATRLKLKEIGTKYARLQKEEAELASLDESIRISQEAEITADLLASALRLMEANQERSRIENSLKDFPTNVAKLLGNELEQLVRMDTKRLDLERELIALNSMAERANEILVSSKFDREVPESVEFLACEKDLEKARFEAQSLLTETERLEKSTLDVAQLLTRLGAGRELPQLTPENIAVSEELTQAMQLARLKCDELKARSEENTDIPSQSRMQVFDTAIEILHSWLAQGKNESPALKVLMYASIILSAAGIGAAIYGKVTGPLAVNAILFLLLVFGLKFIPREQRKKLISKYGKTGLPEPTAWSRSIVTKRLSEITDELAKMREAQAQGIRQQDLKKRLAQAVQAVELLNVRKQELAKAIGFDPDQSLAGLDRFVRLVDKYESAQSTKLVAENRAQDLAIKIEERLGRVKVFLMRWKQSLPVGELIETLGPSLAALKLKCSQADSARVELSTAKKNQSRARKDLDDIQAQEQALLAKNGFATDDRQGLELACSKFAAWKQKDQELKAATAKVVHCRQPIDNNKELLELVIDANSTSLKNKLDQAKLKAEEFLPSKERSAAIKRSLAEAGLDRQLEQQMAEVDDAYSKLEESYEEAIFAKAAGYLLNDIKQEFHSDYQPEVLREARTQFANFTHQSFELEIDDKNGFMAFDKGLEKHRTLSELSSGTCMQLLLAMRIAWTKQLEKSFESLPLFLDEALTSSDEQRFSQIVKSLNQLTANNDRQLFYLSARRHEKTLWEQATGEKIHVIDLAKVRFANPDSAPQDYLLEELQALPSPTGKTAEEFAHELKIPPPDSQASVGQMHLFYLLRDKLILLYHLMNTWRIFNLGQLEALLESNAIDQAIEEKGDQAYLRGRCAVVRQWSALSIQGKGKSVTPSVLHASGSVSSRFIDGLNELSVSVQGDAKLLIRSLNKKELSGFRQNKINELETWFRSEGYIDPLDPLTKEDIERQTIMLAADIAPAEDARQVIHWLESGQPQ